MPSAPSAPIAPALPPVPMGTSVVLAKPVTPVVAAAPLQLQLQELLMQALEQMAEDGRRSRGHVGCGMGHEAGGTLEL